MSLQAMIQALAKCDREHIIRQFVTWEQFQSLESAIACIVNSLRFSDDYYPTRLDKSEEIAIAICKD